jgi:hypothetical protein
MTPDTAASLKEFVEISGKKFVEGHREADLIFIEAVPYGTHDLKSYVVSDTPLSYGQHLKRILQPIRHLVETVKPSDAPPIRIALVISLREMPALPTVEPLLLTILSDETLVSQIDLLGALVSQKRDYTVYLMLLHRSPRMRTSAWSKHLTTLYPELLGDDTVVSLRASGRPASAPAAWDAVCLAAVIAKFAKMPPPESVISLQGPRKVRGKAVFPSRTRSSVVVSETNDTETGSVVFVFGEASEPPMVAVAADKPVISDPLLSRMVSKIQESIAASSR